MDARKFHYTERGVREDASERGPGTLSAGASSGNLEAT